MRETNIEKLRQFIQRIRPCIESNDYTLFAEKRKLSETIDFSTIITQMHISKNQLTDDILRDVRYYSADGSGHIKESKRSNGIDFAEFLESDLSAYIKETNRRHGKELWEEWEILEPIHAKPIKETIEETGILKEDFVFVEFFVKKSMPHTQ